MRAGSLRHIIELQSPTRVPLDPVNDTGAMKTVWTTVSTIYAAIQPQKGVENSVMGVSQGEQVSIFTIRYTKDISRLYRIKFGDRYYSINSIINIDERDRLGMTIHATEISAPPDTTQGGYARAKGETIG